MTASPWSVEDDADEVELEKAERAAEMAERARAGFPIDRDDPSRTRPDRGPSLRRLIPAMELMASVGNALRAGPSPELPLAEAAPDGGLGQLGDFRLVREVGRGGMGVVYEAQQLSLGRRVALKVLPFAASIDPRQIQRFQLEAQAAALLHHTHIVPIHAVGCERGVHYYAMQFLDGRTLADVVREMRRIEGLEADPAAPDSLATRLLSGLASGTPRASSTDAGADPDPDPSPATPRGGSSTVRDRGYFRNVALLGKQAAEALEHAHRNGILHRDIKPANLILDGRGHLWVTDFGLARFQNDPGMTQSGDMLGTLRYMSPEQALARKVVVDQRTDVYSLGVTLYELITLHQAFPGRDRAEILRRIAHEEPAAPRQLVPAIPRDLETVVLKAMAKEAEDRYATARELAEDLGRMLEHRPVLARRPSLIGRALKFSRRYRATVTAVAVVLLITTVLASLAAVEFRRLAAREHELREQDAVVRSELESRLYFHRIDLAARRWEANDVRDFEPLLDQCPPRLRGWEWYYLKGHRRARSVLYPKHERTVQGVAFHPSGTRVASVDSQGGMKVWDPRDGREEATLFTAPQALYAAAFSRDGTRLAAAGNDPVIHVWEGPRWRKLATIANTTGRILSLAFSADGRRVATTGADGAVAIVDVDGGKATRLVGHQEQIQATAFSADGEFLASSSEDGDVKLWDAATGRERHTIRGHVGPVRGLAFRHDGRRLATAGGDGCVKIWDPATGREVQSLRGHFGLVTSVDFDPEGGRLASSSEDGDVKLWDVVTGHELLTLRGHAGPVQAVAYSPDGSCVVSCGDQGDVRVWDVTDVGDDRIHAGHPAAVRCVAYSPDGRRIASAGNGGEVRLWDATAGVASAVLPGHVDLVYGLQFSPDGAALATCGKDGKVRVWDAETGRERLSFEGHGGTPVQGVCYGPGVDRIASVDMEGRLLIWDPRDARVLLRLPNVPGGLLGVDYSPDGRFVAAACRLHTVKVWEAATGRQVHELTGHSGAVKAVKFSPDGLHVASAGADRTIKVWDLATGREALTLAGHTGFIDGLDYSPDGARIASASWDDTVSVWDTRTGLCTLTLRGHTSRVRDVAFSPDGTRIASVGSDRSLRVWTARLAPPYRDPGAGTGGDTLHGIR